MVNYNDHRGGYKWHEGYFGIAKLPKVSRFRLTTAIYTFSVIFCIINTNHIVKYLVNALPYWQYRVTST